MTPSKEDKSALNKLGVSSVLELALITPSSYDDRNISKTPKINQTNVVKVEVLSTSKTHKLFRANVLAWEKSVDVVFFNPTKYHFSAFVKGAMFFIQGKLEYNFAKLQFAQPKILSEVGGIFPVYKTSLQQKTILRLMKNYLSIEELVREGLEVEKATTLYNFHNPSLHVNYEDAYKRTIPVLKYIEIYLFIKKLNSKKQYFKATSVLNGDEKSFIKSLPFKLTNDQLKAIADMKNDLSKDVSARRVVMGDVGSGKTLVIFASVMMAYPKRAILMAPTTILAAQIFEEAKKFLPLHVRVCLVESQDKKINLEEFDFIIGTHVLLYRELPKCDLVMIDEQHRFGVAQRDLIHKLVGEGKNHPHFLQFSATPIPRTMSLINSSLVSYSFIKEMPFKKDISTFVIGKSEFGKMLAHVENEMKMGNQTIVVYPLVEESENFDYQSIDEGRAFWEKRYKNVYVTHGKDKNKEEVIKEFRDKGAILLATTVVEVGISLPKLSTIVIVGAEHLGLATLHQLRGRVSRTGLKGYCYLYTNKKTNERLEEFSKTISGFDIAELDLKYRQSGDILGGLIQHGEQFRFFDIKEDKKFLIEARKILGLM
ncbi:MAG: ATP-dependent DNA helicase RecG [Campylobacteraceae bacterium]